MCVHYIPGCEQYEREQQELAQVVKKAGDGDLSIPSLLLLALPSHYSSFVLSDPTSLSLPFSLSSYSLVIFLHSFDTILKLRQHSSFPLWSDVC